MQAVIIFFLMLVSAGGTTAVQDPNAKTANPAPRRQLGFKVFNNMEQPVTGEWLLEVPEIPSRRIEIKEAVSGNPGVLVGTDMASGEEILRVARKKEGIGYEGQLSKVLSGCGFDTLTISEFLPLGDAAVLRFEVTPPSTPCAPIDSGLAGKLYLFSRRGGPLKLRAFSDISAPAVRESYSIGGDRPNAEMGTELTLSGVAVDDGAELRFLRRVKAPLDGSFWFEVEALVSPEAGVPAPRGFLKPDSTRFVGSLTLKRAR